VFEIGLSSMRTDLDAASLELAALLLLLTVCPSDRCSVLVSLRMQHPYAIHVQISPGDELLNPLDSVNPDPLFSPTTSTTTISKDAAAAVAVDTSNSLSVCDAPLTTSAPAQTAAAAAAAAGSSSDSDSDTGSSVSAAQQQQQSSQPWDVVNSAAAAAAVGTA
jgi:hypothetical protein